LPLQGKWTVILNHYDCGERILQRGAFAAQEQDHAPLRFSGAQGSAQG